MRNVTQKRARAPAGTKIAADPIKNRASISPPHFPSTLTNFISFLSSSTLFSFVHCCSSNEVAQCRFLIIKIHRASKATQHKVRHTGAANIMPPAPTKPSFLQSNLELIGIMLLRFPIKWRLWIVTMLILNMGGVLLFDGIEVQVTAAVLLPSVILMTFLYQQYGFVRLLGVGHIFWPFLVVWIVFFRLPLIVDPNLRLWLIALVTVDSLSLVLDVMDVYRYVQGERKPYFVWNKTKTN